MSWRLLGPARGMHISCNITPPLLEGVPTNQLHQPLYINSNVYWPTVYPTSEDRRLNGIAFVLHTYIGLAAFSTTGDRRLNGIAYLNAHTC